MQTSKLLALKMTENHSFPITPPPELVQQWVAEIWHEGTPVQVALSDEHIATRAAQWGANQEREEICKWLEYLGWHGAVQDIRAAHIYRRPKPPSLKGQSLKHLDVMERDGYYLPEILQDLRRAVEQLND